MVATIRAPAQAGRFYPAGAGELREAVRRHLEAAVPPRRTEMPKALIAPHAGYVYSGPIAASAYATVAAGRGRIRRVVLLGPAHRVALRGLARPGADLLGTPLGPLRVDERLDELVPWVPKHAPAHAEEHSLEVHLPFLHEVLGGSITIAPFVVGAAAPAEVRRVLEALWGGPETLIVVSSDLTHYLPYDTGRAIDEETARSIVEKQTPLDPERACGGRAIDGLLAIARDRGLEVELLDLRSSGDTAGSRDEVVGYGAFALYEPGASKAEPTDEEERSRALLGLARSSMEMALGVPGATLPDPGDDPAWLREPGASFVTLRRRDGELHGCIGSLEAHRPLGEDIRRNAAAAATEDPRAPSVHPSDAEDLVVEISLLGPLQPLRVGSRAELLAALRPGKDGIVLSHGRRRGTFLPQVWESLPEPAAFLGQLERKAGLSAGFWSPDLRVERYEVRKLSERDAPSA